MRSFLRTIRLLGLFPIFIFASGCAYVSPAADMPHATLHMVMNMPHATTVGWRYHADRSCKDKSKTSLGAFSALYEQDKKVLLTANETRTLVVTTETRGVGVAYTCGMPICIGVKICKVAFEITPVSGRTYLATHSGNGSQCSVQIIDETSHQEAPEIKRVPVPKDC